MGDSSLSAHDRIKELMQKSKKKKKKKKKRSNDNLSSLRTVRYNKYHLDGAQFRWMNEMLYNSTSSDAKTKIKNHQKEFSEYHRAYNEIVKNEWPESPLQKIIKSITKKISQLR